MRIKIASYSMPIRFIQSRNAFAISLEILIGLVCMMHTLGQGRQGIIVGAGLSYGNTDTNSIHVCIDWNMVITGSMLLMQ